MWMCWRWPAGIQSELHSGDERDDSESGERGGRMLDFRHVTSRFSVCIRWFLKEKIAMEQQLNAGWYFVGMQWRGETSSLLQLLQTCKFVLARHQVDVDPDGNGSPCSNRKSRLVTSRLQIWSQSGCMLKNSLLLHKTREEVGKWLKTRTQRV